MVILVTCILIINIILWIVLLARFKKLFSTDKIIEKTTLKMNRLVAEIDKATDRNLYLTKESTNNIKKLLGDAELEMELFKEASQRLRNMIAESEKITKIQEIQSPIYEPIPVVKAEEKNNKPIRKNLDAYLKNSKTYDNNKINPNDAYEVKNNEQMDLFESEKKANKNDEINSNITNVTEDGAAYKKVPLIITKVYDETPKNGQNKKKNLTKLVQELYNQGLKEEEIATELSCSVTEVKLIIDMNS